MAVCITKPRAAAEEGDVTQLAPQERSGGGKLEDLHPECPHDAERFAIGLEDDRKLHGAWLLAGLLSEAGLVGMFFTSLHEVGRDASVVVALVVVGLGLAMGRHLLRYRIDGQRRSQSGKRHASRPRE